MRTSAAGPALLASAGVLLTVALFFGGGDHDERLYWIGGGAILVCLVAAVLAPRPVVSRGGVAFLALLTGFVAWNGITIAWSIVPDRSWDYLNRGLVYLAFAVVGLYLGAALPRAPRLVAAGLALLIGAVLVWALAGKVVPALFPDGARVARLRNPVGYWNALALLGDLALPLYLWLAARRRDLAALGLYLAIVAILLTYSRAGLAVAVVTVAVWLWISRERREGPAALAVALPAALAVGGIGLALPGVAKDLQPHSVRVQDGAMFGLALLVGAVLVAFAARRDLRRRELAALALVGGILVLAGIGAIAARGSFLGQFRGSGVTHAASSENRLSWWGEAWRVLERAPAGGKGAGSFEVARTPVRHNGTITTEPHNVALQFLAETGVFGFLLGAACVLAAFAAVALAVRRLEGPERAAGTALAIAVPTYLLHALVDIDWDYVAVSAPLFLVLGVLLARPARERARLRPIWALAALALAAVVMYSLTAPWLSARQVTAAYDAIGRGDYTGAAADARDADSLDPLSVEPLWAWAGAETARGDPGGALRALLLFERATRRQPENSSTWFELGAFQLQGLHDPCDAYDALNHAYTLDPWGPAGRPGGLLDQTRTVRNSGSC